MNNFQINTAIAEVEDGAKCHGYSVQESFDDWKNERPVNAELVVAVAVALDLDHVPLT